jgi:ABC-2 type transport system permease protein
MTATCVLYWEILKLSFKKMMAYRMRYHTGVVTYLIHITVYWYIWKAVYVGRTVIAGFTEAEVTTYIAVGYIARSFYFNYIDREVQARVHSGAVAVDLLRPVDFQLLCATQALGESLFRLFILASPAALAVALIFPILPPASFTHAAMFFVQLLTAFLINLQINFIIGLLAFRVTSIFGIMRAKFVAMDLLSGLFIPLSFFPIWLQSALAWTPFPHIAAIPLASYLGKVAPQDFLGIFAIQVGWTVALFFLGSFVWRWCRKHLSIQGG